MTTRKEIAELSAMLAQRSVGFPPARVADDALKLARFAGAAATNAVNLCNVPNYQARYERKRDGILKHAAPIAEAYRLRVECAGDPRGAVFRFFALPGTPHLRGNGWGGDDDGFGI